MSYKSLSLLPLGLFSALLLMGCQLQQSVSTVRLIQHQAMLDCAGLNETEIIEQVKVHVASPQKWEAVKIKENTMYTNAQWRSPSRLTGVGVAYVRMPIPLPARALVWFVKKEYIKRSGDDSGEMIGEWVDDLGRTWFEAQNVKYHVRGYCVTRGFEAWIIYSGYKRAEAPSAAELGVAARAMETIVPTPFAAEVPQRSMAKAN